MNRILVEWTGILALGIATMLLAYWVFALVAGPAAFHLSFAPLVEVTLADGSAVLGSSPPNLDVIEAVVQDSAGFTPEVVSSTGWNHSLLGFRYIAFADGPPIWSLNTTVVAPALGLILLTYFCHRQVRRLAHKAHTESNQRSS